MRLRSIRWGLWRGTLAVLIGCSAFSATDGRVSPRAALAAGFGCTGTLSIAPATGTLGDIVTVNASGLDPHVTVYIGLYDTLNHPGVVEPKHVGSTSATGTYTDQVQLPGGGVAGGQDTLVVADDGPACASAGFALNPVIATLAPTSGDAFGFGGLGFDPGSSLTITYLDAAGHTSTVDAGSYGTSSYGVAGYSGQYLHLPAEAAPGPGTLQFTDTQGLRATVPYTYVPGPGDASPTPIGTSTATATLTIVPTPTAAGTATATPQPDLTVRLRRGGSFRPGGTVTFLATVRNQGLTANTRSIVLTENLPAGSTYVSSAPVPAGSWFCPPPSGLQVLCFASQLLPAGANIAVVFTAQLRPDLPHPAILIDQARVAADDDINPNNNSARLLVRIP